ncbi:hypothetical protein [Fusobacterium sp. PH5-44]|uniref:hypothetical protein n=1 Tax=unclassified Fusobacterium TaxID=2648384 RepID=UPI003D21A737
MRKALLLFGNEIDREKLVESALYLQNYHSFEIIPLYIKDISRDKVISTSGDGLLIGGRTPILSQGWEEIEKAGIDSIKKILDEKEIKHHLIVDIGIVSEIITEKMKSCDLLIMGKNEVFNEKTISILKGNYKSIIFIGDKALTSMSNVVIANDDGVKINRSCYHYTMIFPEIKNFTSLGINIDLEDNQLKSYLQSKEKNVTHKEIKTDSYDDVIKEVNEYDLLIMGNLSRSYFFEKIIGKNGIKLLEKSKSPIFIG